MIQSTEEEKEGARVTETSSTAGQPTLYDVQFEKVTYDLVAECRGTWVPDDRTMGAHGGPSGERVQESECPWTYRRTQPGVGWSAVRDEARQHALDHPGHEVTVTGYEATTYWLPAPDPAEIQTEGGSDDA